MLKVKDIDETQAPLLDHLIELRNRLVRCVLALAVGFGICLYFAKDIFGILVRPLAQAFPAGEGKLIYTKLYEAFFVDIKVALFGGFFLSFPIIANQLWQFVAPGLYAREKKAFLPFLIATPVLFAMGASLAYFVVMPTAFTWFLGFQGETANGIPVEALPAMGDFLSLVMHFLLAFGISFLLPVLLLLLNRAGLLTKEQLTKGRRYVIVGIFIVAAVVTPPDVISQLILAIPLMLLFEGSLFLMKSEAKIAEEKAKAEAEEAAQEAAEAAARAAAVEETAETPTGG
ncbi:twin-arginine translocase subunit TatC [Croceibacterium sp. LX-88]|uniref:Sec-independent protein translocase protein TatC n=1 Tax=Croceibacterium selenioxidans TaxID=2838833 RepID=A0ABS5W453_9SPHN|nr:twin-arginine translocase subunit TatC [Croceibacterium selenioxidans]MBT2134541.1 twin-arginine translocase subunit TatC [Croceibacterium selenioxidans]